MKTADFQSCGMQSARMTTISLRRPFVSLALVLLVLIVAGCQSAPRPKWSAPVVVENSKVRVVSQSSRFAASRALFVYDQLIRDIRQSSFSGLLRDVPKIEVFLFDSTQDFLDFAPQQDGHGALQGYYLESECQAFTIAKENWPSKPWFVLRHELAHHIHHGAGRRAPWWLSEGFAHYLENGHQLSAPGFATQLQPTVLRLSYNGSGESALKQLSVVRNGKGDSTLQRFLSYLLVRFLIERHAKVFVPWLIDPESGITESTSIADCLRVLNIESKMFTAEFRVHAQKFCTEYLSLNWAQQLNLLYQQLTEINETLEELSEELKANGDTAEEVLGVLLADSVHQHSPAVIKFAQALQHKILITTHIESLAKRPRLLSRSRK